MNEWPKRNEMHKQRNGSSETREKWKKCAANSEEMELFKFRWKTENSLRRTEWRLHPSLGVRAWARRRASTKYEAVTSQSPTQTSDTHLYASRHMRLPNHHHHMQPLCSQLIIKTMRSHCARTRRRLISLSAFFFLLLLVFRLLKSFSVPELASLPIREWKWWTKRQPAHDRYVRWRDFATRNNFPLHYVVGDEHQAIYTKCSQSNIFKIRKQCKANSRDAIAAMPIRSDDDVRMMVMMMRNVPITDSQSVSVFVWACVCVRWFVSSEAKR